MTDTNQIPSAEDDIAEKAADLEATYTLLCAFCCEMQFRPASMTGAMAIMLLELASARGIDHDKGLIEIRALWTRVRDAKSLFDVPEAVH